MVSITWARLATLTIEYRWDHLQSWHDFVNYMMSVEAYDLHLRAQPVRRSPLLVLTFYVHPVLVIGATAIKACLFESPVLDGVSIISLMAAGSHDNHSMLDGAGYSGLLDSVATVRFDVETVAQLKHEFGRVSVYLVRSHELSSSESEGTLQVQISHQEQSLRVAIKKY